jgi:3'(2'), 5'-bisphosphate nucleotidase
MMQGLLRSGDRLDVRDRTEIGEICAALTLEAGPAVMGVYAGVCSVRTKADASPVCEADERAEAIILAGLARRLPGMTVVAEEAAARGETPQARDRFFLVDPLDGTREFLSHNGEFTINIGLVERGVPIAGAVYAPAIARLWYAGAEAFTCAVAPGAPMPSHAAARQIHARHAPADGLVAIASRSHADPQTDAFLRGLPIRERRCAGSSLKFCLLAEGEADVYPRFAPTMEWDTAAGEAILRAAGGFVETCDHGEFRYGKSEAQYRNGGFIAWADPQRARSAPHCAIA